MSGAPPRVSIGLPTYNRPELLALVLECFREQTFADFELIISDNASPNPDVENLCERYARQDCRFHYVRQPANRGAESNFWFVYDQARAPLFLWASDDDLWPVDFLEKGVAALEENPSVSAWFCQVVNINMRGDTTRSYPGFGRFRSGTFKFADLAHFLWEPEILGKANLIYSIFRREALSQVIQIFREHPPSWGSDMNLVYACLCRFNLIVAENIVLLKRIPTESVEMIYRPRAYIYPREERAIYFEKYRLAAAGTGYEFLTWVVLAARSAYDNSWSKYETWRGRLLRVGRRILSRMGV
jgi:glycosyltransferase involved in cell wall biosynthesis